MVYDLAHFQNSHDRLQSLIKELESLIRGGTHKSGPRAKTAHELWCELGLEIQGHLNGEDHALYPSLLMYDDPQVQSLAWGFINDECPLRQHFHQFQNKWLLDCDLDYSKDFIRESQEIIQMIARRIKREKRELFPILREINPPKAA